MVVWNWKLGRFTKEFDEGQDEYDRLIEKQGYPDQPEVDAESMEEVLELSSKHVGMFDDLES